MRITIARTMVVAFAITLGAACTATRTPTVPGATTDTEAATAEAAAETALKNTVRWATATEVDNFAFDVYRGETDEGPFTRLTKTPVPGAGTTDEPTRYEFVDETIEPGKAYFYYIEDISMTGQRRKISPVYEAPPKGTAAGAAQPSETATE